MIERIRRAIESRREREEKERALLIREALVVGSVLDAEKSCLGWTTSELVVAMRERRLEEGRDDKLRYDEVGHLASSLKEGGFLRSCSRGLFPPQFQLTPDAH